MTNETLPPALAGQVERGVRQQRRYTRDELVNALRIVGESMGGACAQAADLLAADGASRLLLGDYFTHDRSAAQHAKTLPQYWDAPKPRVELAGKPDDPGWCRHCNNANHTDGQCWSTRAL